MITSSFLLPSLLLAQSEKKIPDVLLTIASSGDNCEWTGGTDGEGNVVIENRKQGKQKIQVRVLTEGYTMELKGFRGNGKDQMDEDAVDKGKKKTVLKINNKNTGPADVNYDIWAYDSGGKITACDPKVINK